MYRSVQTSRLFYMAFALFSLQAFVEAAPQTLTRVQDPKCLQPMEPGPCRMNLERYYYNKQTNSCETFKFGGCRGNDNKFGFRQTCEEACVPKAVTANRQSDKPTQISTTTTTTTTTSKTIVTTPAKQQKQHSTTSPKPKPIK